MANISQIQKVTHQLTQAEVSAFLAVVPVRWKTPFNDTNYVISCYIESPNVTTAGPSGNIVLYQPTIRNVTPTGFDAAIPSSVNSAVDALGVITVHAMASHK